MVVRIPQHTNNFTIVDKGFLDDPALSLKAKGLLACLLSRPRDWRINVLQLARAYNESPWAIRRVLAELESAGYIKKTRRRLNGRYSGIDYTVYETKQVMSVKDQRDSTLRNHFDGEAAKEELDPTNPRYSTKYCTYKSTSTKYSTKRFIDHYVPRSTEPCEDTDVSSQRAKALRGKTIRKLVSQYQKLHFERPKRDQFSFIGGLVKRFGADAVEMAIEEMARLPADRFLENPRGYLRAILSYGANREKMREELRRITLGALQCGRRESGFGQHDAGEGGGCPGGLPVELGGLRPRDPSDIVRLLKAHGA